MSMQLGDLRTDYQHQDGLLEANMAASPIDEFKGWLSLAIANSPGEWFEPTAMTLATVGTGGQPAARVVLLKEIDDANRFVFFTSYASDKAAELAANPQATLAFYWGQLGRQVRIDGTVEKTDRETSAKYFATRPRSSQLGAVASDQSHEVTSREALEAALAAAEAKYEGQDVPVPDDWGGYQLTPTRLEFWQGRPNRLHDRLVYQREGDGWTIRRLGP